MPAWECITCGEYLYHGPKLRPCRKCGQAGAMRRISDNDPSEIEIEKGEEVDELDKLEQIKCETCDGSGTVRNSDGSCACSECLGEGLIYVCTTCKQSNRDDNGDCMTCEGGDFKKDRCSICTGKGFQLLRDSKEQVRCGFCKGTGIQPDSETWKLMEKVMAESLAGRMDKLAKALADVVLAFQKECPEIMEFLEWYRKGKEDGQKPT